MHDTSNKISLMWALLAVVALSIAGVLSLSVVFLRIPYFASMILDPQHFFDLSLAVHVNFSVLVWMTSICMSGIKSVTNGHSKMDYIAFVGACISTLCIVLSLFLSKGIVYKSNYIPVIEGPLFLTGIFSFLLFTFGGLYISAMNINRGTWIYYAVYSIMITFGCAIVSFVAAYIHINHYNGIQFYETLFWGGGHILQFFFMEAFVLLCCLKNDRLLQSVSNKIMSIGYMLVTCIVIAAPFVYLLHNAGDPIAVDFFIRHMVIFGAFLPCFFILSGVNNLKIFVFSMFRDTALLSAFLLSLYGGILGFLAIQGNVTVPAHYHGSVVGITIVFMGFVYHNLGFEPLNSTKLTLPSIQIYLYAFGQILHITALEWLGGYNALRKTSSLPDGVSGMAKALFGIGSLLSVIAGFMFCVIVLIKIYRHFHARHSALDVT